jgi:hypothetical protein
MWPWGEVLRSTHTTPLRPTDEHERMSDDDPLRNLEEATADLILLPYVEIPAESIKCSKVIG